MNIQIYKKPHKRRVCIIFFTYESSRTRIIFARMAFSKPVSMPTKPCVTNVFTERFIKAVNKFFPEESRNAVSLRTDPKLLDFIKKYEDDTGEAAFFQPRNQIKVQLERTDVPICLIPFSQSNEVDFGEDLQYYTISFDIPLAMATATKEELSRTIDTTLPMADQLAQEREKQEKLLSRMEELMKAQRYVLEQFPRMC